MLYEYSAKLLEVTRYMYVVPFLNKFLYRTFSFSFFYSLSDTIKMTSKQMQENTRTQELLNLLMNFVHCFFNY